MSDQLREALDDLARHPGWLWFLGEAKREWGEGYGRKVKLAIMKAQSEKQDVVSAVLAVDYANDEINRLLDRPREELARLTPKKDVDMVTVMSRGGL